MLEDYEDFFIDPEYKEFQETIRNARKKLETPMAPAMPCKTSKKISMERPVARPMISNQNLLVSWKLVNPEECVRKNLPNYQEDHIAGKGDNSLQHYNLVHKFTPVPQSHDDSRSISSSR